MWCLLNNKHSLYLFIHISDIINTFRLKLFLTYGFFTRFETTKFCLSLSQICQINVMYPTRVYPEPSLSSQRFIEY